MHLQRVHYLLLTWSKRPLKVCRVFLQCGKSCWKRTRTSSNHTSDLYLQDHTQVKINFQLFSLKKLVIYYDLLYSCLHGLNYLIWLLTLGIWFQIDMFKGHQDLQEEASGDKLEEDERIWDRWASHQYT